jgi:hypothetical protein
MLAAIFEDDSIGRCGTVPAEWSSLARSASADSVDPSWTVEGKGNQRPVGGSTSFVSTNSACVRVEVAGENPGGTSASIYGFFNLLVFDVGILPCVISSKLILIPEQYVC